MHCILLCGGDATRMLPITGGRFEKTMLRLRGKPIVRLVIDRIRELTTQITICVLDRFLDDFRWEMRDLQFCRFNSSEKAMGTLGHYMKATTEIGFSDEADVLIYYGDTISNIDLRDMKRKYYEMGSK